MRNTNNPSPIDSFPLPTQFVQPLVIWFGQNARVLPWRQTNDPYKIWVSEIMLQQTRVEAVIDYYNRFLAAFPDLGALACADISVVLKHWEGLGYYSRAKNLHKAAKVIQEQYQGVFPSSLQEITSLPGIGAYTAGAIASIAFEQPTPAVDGNVLRVVSRLCASELNIDEPGVKKAVSEALVPMYTHATSKRSFTEALMELGATVCLPGERAKCDICPLNIYCAAKQAGMQQTLPIKSPKKQKDTQTFSVFIIHSTDKIALRKRTQKGLLQELFELPNTPGLLTSAQVAEFLNSIGIFDFKILRTCQKKHIFTHKIWEMTGFYVTTSQKADGLIWADSTALEKEFALPTAFRQFLE